MLVLIGFMGAGKSTIGRLLALQLACPFIDLDVEIARTHGSIPDLFSSRGESGFRAIEHHHLDLHSSAPEASHGAGPGWRGVSPARQSRAARPPRRYRDFSRRPFEVVRARIADSGHQRPLARDPERLRNLFELRRPTYLLAHHTLDASGNEPAELLASLVQLANRLGVYGPARDKL